MKITKLACNSQSIEKYLSQTNVIRRTNMSSTLNYGKIAVFSDSDVDG